MLTVSPDVTDVFTLDPCEIDEDEDNRSGDPDCEFNQHPSGLHVCTDRDGHVVNGSGKACFAWARSQLLTEARDDEADAAAPPSDDRCEHCAETGAVYVITAAGIGHLLCNPCADVDAEGPDNHIYGFSSGNPSFHTHARRPELGCHQHADGTAPHHHDSADVDAEGPVAA